MIKTILLLGGNGKTTSPIASILHSDHPSVKVIRTSRSPAGPNTVKFDWFDESTFVNPFSAGSQIDAVYLVAPNSVQMVPVMKSFINVATSNGVQRFVLMSASLLEPGGQAMGAIHQYLIEIGVDYCVLRPTWFMQNLSVHPQHVEPIRDKDIVYSATENGKVPWVSADDIAAVGARALTDEKSHNTDHIIIGSELLTYDQLALQLSTSLGRPIKHVKFSEADMVTYLLGYGFEEAYASFLALMDVAISKGAEERTNNVVEEVTGRKPVTFKEFVEENRDVWMKK